MCFYAKTYMLFSVVRGILYRDGFGSLRADISLYANSILVPLPFQNDQAPPRKTDKKGFAEGLKKHFQEQTSIEILRK